MHNNIMAAGLRDRPPMLATGRYAQWRSRFLRYIDTRPNGDTLRNCILKGRYTPMIVTTPAVPATEDSPAIPKQTTVETVMNMTPKNRAHFESEKEVIHLILTGIGDEIYSTVDAYTYYQSSKSHKSYAPTLKALLPTKSHATTRSKGKDIAKTITPPSESASEEDSDPEQAQRDKDMQENLALIARYFKKIYKPTNNNLRTSSNTRNKNVDTTPRYKNDNQPGQFRNQRKKMIIACKQAEKGVNFKQSNLTGVTDMDEEIDEQELEAHYRQTNTEIVFANDIQHFEQSESISNTCAVETGDSNVIPDSPDMCDNDIQDDQNDVECDDERVALANLIANLKLDVDENKKIQKQLKKANATLTQELTECKSILVETSRTLGESNSVQDSFLVVLQNKQNEFERYKAFNDRTVGYDKLELVKEKHDELVKQSLLTKSHYKGLVKEKTKVITDLKLKEEKDIDKMISMENQLKFLNEIVSQSIQNIHMLAPKCPTFNGSPTFANP
ncbi:hypothetical protein Tco_0943982, partial [Tanacetum coccineum]